MNNRKWFEIDQEVKYRVSYGGASTEGTGRTVNISSGGVYFRTEGGDAFSTGQPIELAIHWPVLLNDACPIKLVVHGWIMPSDLPIGDVVVSIARYEFRTRALLPAAPEGHLKVVELVRRNK